MKPVIRAAALAVLVVTTCEAQTNSVSTSGAVRSTNTFSRADKWEAYGVVQVETIFNVFDSDANLIGGGFGVGYNFGEHFTLSGEFSISSAQFQTDGLFEVPQERDTTLYIGRVYADYNILKYPVTPVLSGGFGVGGFSDGSGVALDQTIGLGVRWDANDRLVFKSMLRTGIIETTSRPDNEDADGWACLAISVSVGYKF
jgi:hypothetical protein